MTLRKGGLEGPARALVVANDPLAQVVALALPGRRAGRCRPLGNGRGRLRECATAGLS